MFAQRIFSVATRLRGVATTKSLIHQRRPLQKTQMTFVPSLNHFSTDPSFETSKGSTDSSSLIIEQKAQERLKKVLEPHESLRIGVKGGGCSGFEYQFEIVSRESADPNEDLVICDGNVLVDRESLEYMSGATLEYEEELIRSGFKISHNPLAEKGCSCGASFALKF